jgi:hypothetical protein
MTKTISRQPEKPPLTVDGIYERIRPQLEAVHSPKTNHSGFVVTPTMQKAAIIMDELMGLFFDGTRGRFYDTRESAGVTLPNGSVVPPHSRELSRELYKRTADGILQSSYLIGGGCMELCTVFIPLAKKAGIKISRIVQSAAAEATKEYERGPMNIPHTTLEIGDPDDAGAPTKIIDPRWCRLPGFDRQTIDRWESQGLARVNPTGVRATVFDEAGRAQKRTLNNPPDGLEAWERLVPGGKPDAWIMLGELDALPSMTFDTRVRGGQIRGFFRADSRRFS